MLLFVPEGYSERQKSIVVNALLKSGISSIQQLSKMNDHSFETIQGVKKLGIIIKKMREAAQKELDSRMSS